ncbi:MAG: hypothetical protein H6709_18860 [Kofleriaceae bacterium]|nr:hypothetical protein [Kofleriaceae bacterium]MCB9574150.1 hypothetical protein [Kofleriaceae bacterium]
MEGSAAYARSYLKSDLRNTRTLLGLIEGASGGDAAADGGDPAEADAADEPLLTRLSQLVHDLTVGLRESAAALGDLDLDALRRSVELAAEAAARERRIADDTLRQWARSFERLLPWWQTLPPAETLLDDARWPAPAPGVRVLEVAVTADERFRVHHIQRTRDQILKRFAKHVSKHPAVRAVRFVDEAGEVFATCAAAAGPASVGWA